MKNGSFVITGHGNGLLPDAQPFSGFPSLIGLEADVSWNVEFHIISLSAPPCSQLPGEFFIPTSVRHKFISVIPPGMHP